MLAKMNDREKRAVMTLDAGGTNFRFSAIQGGKAVVEPVAMPAHGTDLDRCLGGIMRGFDLVRAACPVAPAAISFAFPGPADYPAGVIGDLWNLPAFRGGVALGPMLEEKFGIPAYINNDGDLFVYGEAIAGLLPYVNGLLERAGSRKRYRNLFGVTLGTGFGGGIVWNGELVLGDNSIGGEVWLLRNKRDPQTGAEEGASIRAVCRTYAELTGTPFDDAPEPKTIFQIGIGQAPGNREAARESFRRLGEVVGSAMADVLTLIDSPAVIGGGLSGAAPLFMPAIMAELNGSYVAPDGTSFRRLTALAFNLDEEAELREFLIDRTVQVAVPGSSKKAWYDPVPRVAIGLSRLGTSEAVAIGAYAFALRMLDGGR
jgi:glucokinase